MGIFIDNRPGAMFAVMDRLEGAQIKIFALSIAEWGEFGLMRLITDNPELASNVLEEVDFQLAKSSKNTEVIVILITEKARISNVTKILSDNRINIEYAYSSSLQNSNNNTALVLRVSDTLRAEKILKENKIILLSLEELERYFQ